MNIEKIIKDFKEMSLANVLTNEPMSKHTTFKVGGPADILVEPKNIEDIIKLMKYIKSENLPFFIMGNGSNLVVKDKGIRGIVMKIYDNFDNVSVENDIIKAGAGIILSKLSRFALNNSLAGLEFASGIPGTLGGAIFMNAGAYGGQMSDIVEETLYIDNLGNLKTLQKNEHEFGYRKSYFSKDRNIILEAKLKLHHENREIIKANMDALTRQRIEKQPLSMPSAGSVFKRPEGYYTGKLIQDAGLKGFSIGDAQVSEKHSGFIVNKGKATAKEILGLINYVQEQVEVKFGVKLETEVKIIGED